MTQTIEGACKWNSASISASNGIKALTIIPPSSGSSVDIWPQYIVTWQTAWHIAIDTLQVCPCGWPCIA